MSEYAYATHIRPTYENFEATCPSCERLNIFNRASDLKTFQPIAFREVLCLHCGQGFCINSDIINPAYQCLVLDARELLQVKRYAASVLNAAQAFETFFSHYLRLALVPGFYWPQAHAWVDDINAIRSKLYDTIKNLTYKKLRDVFLNTVLAADDIQSTDRAYEVIDTLPSRARRTPTNADLQTYPDHTIAALLQQLKDSTVHELRNRVIHKDAYRPTLSEAAAALEEAAEVLFPLGVHLLTPLEARRFTQDGR